jgi:hypothetical protein
MGAIVKANASIMSGVPQLTTYNIATDASNVLTINAEFVVLSQLASTAYSTFRIGSALHSSLATKSDVLTALSGYSASALPLLTGVDITTANGLATISVVYATNTNITSNIVDDESDNPQVTSEITTNTDLRSFSGSVSVRTNVTEDGQQVTKYINRSFSFDYYSTSVTTEGAVSALFTPGSDADKPINIRGISPGGLVSKLTSFATRTYRNNLGAYQTQQTSTTVYIQTKFILP